MHYKISTAFLFFSFFIISCTKNNPAPKQTPQISGFTITTKYIGDSTFLIPQAVSNSTGKFTYSSSNPAVAAVKGDSVQIIATGSVTITATQASSGTFNAGTTTTTFNVLPSVYVVGWTFAVHGYQPVYWRNGVVTNLPGSGPANCIFIQNGDVYVGGNTLAGTYVAPTVAACYWKNGVIHVLNNSGNVNGITVQGNDVYAVGSIGTGDPNNDAVAALWKNGQYMPLTNPLTCCNIVTPSLASAVAISGGAIYVAGTAFDTKKLGAATVWKLNGAATALIKTATDTVSTAYGITFQGNDMYICGSIGLSDGNGNAYTGYWKNGAFTGKPMPSYLSPANTSIALNGSDVYIAGIDGSFGASTAAVWKNGVETKLATSASATGIAFSGNDMYVTGTLFSPIPTNIGHSTAVYWLNGSVVNLPAPASVYSATTTGILIRTQ